MSFAGSGHPLASGMPYLSQLPQAPSQPGRPYRQGPIINSRPQMYARPVTPPPTSTGPTITVFVGNISERASEQMIKKILSCVGYVLNWKRVSTFGFCDYDGPLAGSRAVRLLHELEVDGKPLVAKVDAKNKQLLDNYQEEEDRAGEARDGDVEQRNDESTLAQIAHILEEHREEMESYHSSSEKEQASGKHAKVLKDTDLEDDKRDIIHREIGKFRKFAEEEEQKKEKEKDRRKREEKTDRDAGKAPRVQSPPPRREVQERKKDRRRSRSIERYEREREERERERDRERERERERDRAREDVTLHKNVRDVQRSKEMEDELRERKKLEKRARDKEAAYQERLRNWEMRERRKAKDYERDSERERCREEDRELEAKRLKEFLEDYEDERDDPKYYKGKELQRRLSERLREADADAKDRAREQEELEELKAKIFTGEYVDPNEEFERQRLERERLYKPRLLIDVNMEASQQREAELARERDRETERLQAKERERHQKELYVMAQASRELAAVDAEPIDSDSSNEGPGAHDGTDSATPSLPGILSPASHPAMNTSMISLNLGAAHAKKKRLEVKDVFSIDEEADDAAGPKKRKLVPLDYADDKQGKGLNGDAGMQQGATAAVGNQKKSTEDLARSQEERRKQIKSIIDKIPTEKADLFAFKLEWSEIDQTLMEKKIRPWINKKIIEYIGEPEPTLVDFICSKVMAGSTPAGILDDVQMVLDEEAEVFVVKMWRLLIYEVEAKKLGLGSSSSSSGGGGNK